MTLDDLERPIGTLAENVRLYRANHINSNNDRQLDTHYEQQKCRPVILHRVHKKLYPYIRCHNSGKQRRILTKFYANTETLNCKQAPNFSKIGQHLQQLQQV